MNKILGSLCLLCMSILLLLMFLRKLKQPNLVAYILAGILLGPHVFGLISETEIVQGIGDIGILLLMFFLGMELKVPDTRSFLRKPLIAQGTKTLLSFLFSCIIGYGFGLDYKSTLLVAIFFLLNSTAVVGEYLEKNNELKTSLGITILNILLLQDLLLAPVLTLLKTWGEKKANLTVYIIPALISLLLIAVMRIIRHRRKFVFEKYFIHMPADHEVQVFFGLSICLGLGCFSELIGFGSALGSFMAGVFIGRINALSWLERALKPFKVFFVGLYFVSIGLQFDLSYLQFNYKFILAGTFLLLLSNSLLSAIVFKLLKYDWKRAFYGGALLSQTGEFGLLIFSTAYQKHIINYSLYKSGIGITCLSLLLSGLWISCLKYLTGFKDKKIVAV